MSAPKYKRILLKLSGEALADTNGILNFEFISSVAKVLKKCTDAGVEVGVIVGAGNIWRGRQGGEMNRARADHMGMLATTINSLALQDTFIQHGLDTVVMTAVEMKAFAEPYTTRGAINALSEGKVVILGCGLGSPYFSTDTGLKTATKYDEITYAEMIAKELGALDLTAAAFCMANGITSYAFELKDPMNIYRVAMGEKIGTELHK